jgi:hypothetical protein
VSAARKRKREQDEAEFVPNKSNKDRVDVTRRPPTRSSMFIVLEDEASSESDAVEESSAQSAVAKKRKTG